MQAKWGNADEISDIIDGRAHWSIRELNQLHAQRMRDTIQEYHAVRTLVVGIEQVSPADPHARHPVLRSHCAGLKQALWPEHREPPTGAFACFFPSTPHPDLEQIS